MKFRGKRFKSYAIVVITLLVVSSVMAFTPAVNADNNKPLTEKNIFADIAAQANDGVVKVTSYVEVERRQRHPFFNDPYFEYFFGDQFPERNNPQQEQPPTREGYGSGFIVSEDGYIVTNQHVINDAKNVEVTINGIKDPVPAEIVWQDFSLDLAVLKVDTDEDLTVIEMGNSDNIRPGDWAIAIGNPFGFEHTVTTGVISALGRPIQVPTSQGQTRTYRNLIQTDAAINPGNSGGPLLNIDGKAIGINTAVSRQGQGIGFAIPINEIKGIIKELKATGEVTRPWLGIYFRSVNEDIKDYFDLQNTKGVLVTNIVEGSPAAKAGLKPYDIIKEIDRKEIEGTDELSKIIKKKEIGDRIMIKVIRNGNSQVIFANIGKKPDKM